MYAVLVSGLLMMDPLVASVESLTRRLEIVPEQDQKVVQDKKVDRIFKMVDASSSIYRQTDTVAVLSLQVNTDKMVKNAQTNTTQSIDISQRGPSADSSITKNYGSATSGLSYSCGLLTENISDGLDDQFAAALNADTETMLEDLQKDSKLFREQIPRNLPRFEIEELSLSSVIGSGEFGEVCSILAIKDVNRNFCSSTSTSQSVGVAIKSQAQQGSFSSSSSPLESSQTTPASELGSAKKRPQQPLKHGSKVDADDALVRDIQPDDLRAFMAERCFREETPRYAVKRIASLLNSEMTIAAVFDLASEAKFLSHLDHSNIIKVRATAGNPGTLGFMIVLDRLTDILDKRVVAWKLQDQSYQRYSGVLRGVLLGCGSPERRNLATERLTAMFDVARALRYLHAHNVLFRDLKPENIGCDVRGDFKIFDFGLARELKEKDLVEKPDGYNITGLVGTRRWMAPEVCLCKNYGNSSDVFSFCMLFWHVMTMILPYDKYDSRKHTSKVVNGGHRPNLRMLKVGKTLKDAIVRGWGAKTSQRPTMKQLCEQIQIEILVRKSEDADRKRHSEGISSVLDRSRFLVDRSRNSLFGA